MADYIEMVGTIWMPATTAAMRKDLSDYDVRNIRGYAEHLSGDAQITREAVEHWLSLNSGDFQAVDDFHASIGALDIPWNDEENELTFIDCMGESDD